jgi:hypothetical protein
VTGPGDDEADVLRRQAVAGLPPACKTRHTGADCERQVTITRWAQELRHARKEADVSTVGTLVGHLAVEQGYCFEALDIPIWRALLREVAAAVPHHPAAALAALGQLIAHDHDAPFSLVWLLREVRQAQAIYQLIIRPPVQRRDLIGMELRVLFHPASIEPLLAYPQCRTPTNRDVALALIAVRIGLTGEEVIAARTDRSTDRTLATLAVLKDPSLAPWVRHLAGPL